MGKYAKGFVIAQLVRFLKVFPNNDPLMGFVLPAAKNEKWWKAPLFAFSAIIIFDLLTSFGVWSIVTAATYALVAVGARFFLKNKKSSLFIYAKTSVLGILAFDFVTGPLMSTFLFQQNFFVTMLLQIPFTAMHVISGTILAAIIVPFYDPVVALEAKAFIVAVKKAVFSWVPQY